MQRQEAASGPRPDPESTPRPPRLSGRVQGPEGAPIGGATLHAVGALDEARPVARTDERGRFALEHAPATLEACAPRYAARRLVVTAPEDELVFTLARGEPLAGRVVAREDGRPLPGARIEATSGEWRGAAATDAVGSFVLEDVPEGALVSVRALIPGRIPAAVPATAGAGRDVTVALERGATAKGRVLDETGAPVEAEVYAFARPGAAEAQATRSGRDGCFEVGGLPHGCRVALVALTPRLASRLQDIEWRPLRGEHVLVAAERGALAVAGLPGGSFELAPVAAPGALPSLERSLESAGDGALLRAARLAPGRYRLLRDGAPVSIELEVASGETTTLKWPEIQTFVGGAAGGRSVRPSANELTVSERGDSK